MAMVQRKQPVSGKFARAIASEVRSSMARERISAVQLAALTGISRSYLGKRLRDETPFTLNDIEAIASALGGDMKEFRAAAARAMRGDD